LFIGIILTTVPVIYGVIPVESLIIKSSALVSTIDVLTVVLFIVALIIMAMKIPYVLAGAPLVICYDNSLSNNIDPRILVIFLILFIFVQIGIPCWVALHSGRALYKQFIKYRAPYQIRLKEEAQESWNKHFSRERVGKDDQTLRFTRGSLAAKSKTGYQGGDSRRDSKR
jgi:hypothetical protein